MGRHCRAVRPENGLMLRRIRWPRGAQFNRFCKIYEWLLEGISRNVSIHLLIFAGGFEVVLKSKLPTIHKMPLMRSSRLGWSFVGRHSVTVRLRPDHRQF